MRGEGIYRQEEETMSPDGLATVEQYYNHYGLRAKELKNEGKRIVGYLSALVPVEILTAAGVVCVRLKGAVSETITKADAYMETIVCPFVRNVFDSVLKGKYDYLDGLVLPHLCDSMSRTPDIWSYTLQLPYFHYLNMPHVTDGPSLDLTKELFRIFIRSLESMTGKKISDADLAQAITVHNENREVMRELYSLRRFDVPLISGVEMMKVLVAAMSLPVEESTALVKAVTKEVKDRPNKAAPRQARIMVMADQIDDIAIADTIESAGAWMVMDDISIGSKMYDADVDASQEPIAALADRYLRKVKLPTTVESGLTHDESLERRFGYLKRYTEDFKVNGVVLTVYRYCDPYGFQVPTVKSFVESAGAQVLYLEDEYSMSALPRMKTRIEAFLEMINQ
jgi:benzoyl-CoA reductase/2-hydroxyglutaryl-CoA dehydratase subunit BcrC/BadD/HgdB